MKLTNGSVFAKRYRVVRAMAQGGMGAVYEVVHIETERRRALKVMRPEIVSNEDMKRRFRQEAKVAARIGSDFIVDVADAGIDEESGLPFLVMELLDGKELAAIIEEKGRLEVSEALEYLEQISHALDRSHAVQVVHRDLKPDNVFVTRRSDGSPQIKILDFGIAKVLEGTVHGNPTRNLGTPLYMAPEQFKPGAAITPKTDIFALAMLSYTMLVGQIYWYEEASGQGNVFEFAKLAMQGPVESAVLRAQRQGVQLPEAFGAWFVEQTHVDPALRSSSAEACVAALRRVLSPLAGASDSAAGGGASAGGVVAAPTGALAARRVASTHEGIPLEQNLSGTHGETRGQVQPGASSATVESAPQLEHAANPSRVPSAATELSPEARNGFPASPVQGHAHGAPLAYAASAGHPAGALPVVSPSRSNKRPLAIGVGLGLALVVAAIVAVFVFASKEGENRPADAPAPPPKARLEAKGAGGSVEGGNEEEPEGESIAGSGANGRPRSPHAQSQPPAAPTPTTSPTPGPAPAPAAPSPDPNPGPRPGANNGPPRPGLLGGKRPGGSRPRRKRRRRRRIIRR
jgi:eukaryotic-like serine/threonine-protein kinase